MPKVSQEHLERRRLQIIDAAWACFSRKGFHETSMQDIFQESGLSAGAVYRYFRSKDELIQAIALENQHTLTGGLKDLLDQDPVPPIDEIVTSLCATVMSRLGPGGRLRIIFDAWAEAMHNPAVGDVIRDVMIGTREWWTQIAEKLRDAGRLPADADPEAVALVLFSIVQGAAVQYLLVGDIDPEQVGRGVRALI
jgi:AcrR family transcriptional regulator